MSAKDYVKYAGIERFSLSEREQELYGEWTKQNFFDIPLRFEHNGEYMTVNYLHAGIRILKIVFHTASQVIAGGFGTDEVSHQGLRIAIQLGEDNPVATYHHAYRRSGKVPIIGKWDAQLPQDTLYQTAMAMKFGQYHSQMNWTIREHGYNVISDKILRYIFEDGRPVVIYGELGKYKDLFEANKIAVTYRPFSEAINDSTYINFCPVNHAFLSLREQQICISANILTPMDTCEHGLEIGTMYLDHVSIGDKANLVDYQITNMVSDLRIINEVAIRQVVKKSNPTFLIFPGDGNGVGASVAESLGIPYVSSDIFPRDPRVKFETLQETLSANPDGLVVLSRVLQFLSTEEKELLEDREVVVIDRHHLHGWYRSFDGLISTNSKKNLPVVAQQDRRTKVPEAALPYYLINYSPVYKVDLVDSELISLCRFIKLHNWATELNTPLGQKAILMSYNVPWTDKEGMEMGNSPLAEVDFYSGVRFKDRWFYSGLSRVMGIHDVAVLRDEAKSPGGQTTRIGSSYCLRFREPGKYEVTLSRSIQSKRSKYGTTKVTVEVVHGHHYGLTFDKIIGSCAQVDLQEVKQGLIIKY